jgi:chromosome segregation ATPase
MKRSLLVLCGGLALVLVCGVPGWGEPAPAAGGAPDQLKQLQGEMGALRSKIDARMKDLSQQDPEIKALKDAIEAKRKEVADADAAVVTKVAAKDPEVKTLVDQRTALTAKSQDSAKKIEDLRKQIDEIQKQGQDAQKELGNIVSQISTKVRAHQKDEDLKDVFQQRTAKDAALQQAQAAPLSKAAEKHPDVKEMVTKQADMEKQIRALRDAAKPTPPAKPKEGAKAETKVDTKGAAGK